ncbi:MAG TPA: nuclear transport factor 2 family protein [Acidimicrobiia bacterium]
MPSPEQVRAAIDAYAAAYRENDRDAFLDVFADGGVIIDPVGTPAHVGREARGAFWDTVHQLTEKITFDVKDVVVCGYEAAMVFGIHAGSGDSGIVLDAVDIFEVNDDGKVTLMKAYWDMSRATPAT